ncbi:hypothetical protein VTN77DRAFT_3495 [Rasamsonia byssochlamydoides]|uniref:uncharacterized protein n=1 Tax=Rasamsonia byssochlamydoides TaxID=89139 RepID=UPI00374486C6
MWAPHSPTSSTRSSARNVDLREALLQDETALEKKAFPRDTEMWITKQQRRSRTSSMQSVAVRSETMSTSSRQSSIAVEEEEERNHRESTESPPFHIEAWQIPDFPRPEQQRGVVQAQKSDTDERRESISGSTENSHSTLAEDISAVEPDLKTPKVVEKPVESPLEATTGPEAESSESSSTAVDSQEQQPAIAYGPLGQQLLSLLEKVSAIERNQPTVMAEDYQKLEARVAELEAEKQTWQQRHEALFALRDEDVANLITIRELLAHERREHEALRKLRDEDLKNVIELRHKLAQATWSSSKQEQQQQQSPPTTTTTGTPPRVVPAKRLSLSRTSEGTDLWRAAKIAAMEQKVLELERANTDLRAQLDRAHTALLASSSSQPAQVAKTNNTKAGPGDASLGTGLAELIEGALRHRERFIVKIERLRAENEELRKELSRKEDENAELEHTIEKLRMKLELGR